MRLTFDTNKNKMGNAASDENPFSKNAKPDVKFLEASEKMEVEFDKKEARRKEIQRLFKIFENSPEYRGEYDIQYEKLKDSKYMDEVQKVGFAKVATEAKFSNYIQRLYSDDDFLDKTQIVSNKLTNSPRRIKTNEVPPTPKKYHKREEEDEIVKNLFE